jgi:pyrroline-5-carboxylate reductase
MEQECGVKMSVKIGFIGAGNMAKAIGQGLTSSGTNKHLRDEVEQEKYCKI